MVTFLWKSHMDLGKVGNLDFDSQKWITSMECSIVKALAAQFFYSDLGVQQQYLPLLSKMYANNLFHCNPRIRSIASQFLARLEDIIHPILPIQIKAFAQTSVDNSDVVVTRVIRSQEIGSPTLQKPLDEHNSIENDSPQLIQRNERQDPVSPSIPGNGVSTSMLDAKPIVLPMLPTVLVGNSSEHGLVQEVLPTIPTVDQLKTSTSRDNEQSFVSDDEMDIEIPEICIDDDGPDNDE
jgi:hypothetical protein